MLSLLACRKKVREIASERKYERITKSLKINIIKKELYQVEQQRRNEGA
jgi:hypothetical protein